MVLVLQRRVLVMDPRIILRGAIPIDSNIGGYNHRPLFGEVVSCGCFVCRVPFWLCVLHGLVVSCWLGVFVQRPSFSCARNVHLIELTVLPRLAAVLPLWEARYYRATARYYRSGAVLRKYRAGRYYRVGAWYYHAVDGAWGL